MRYLSMYAPLLCTTLCPAIICIPHNCKLSVLLLQVCLRVWCNAGDAMCDILACMHLFCALHFVWPLSGYQMIANCLCCCCSHASCLVMVQVMQCVMSQYACSPDGMITLLSKWYKQETSAKHESDIIVILSWTTALAQG